MSQYKPHSAYKDSGVEWLGRVPEHWDVTPVKMLFRLRNGFPFASDRFQPSGKDSDRLIRIRDILGNDSCVYTDENCPPAAIVKNGDVLIGMDGDFNVVDWKEGTSKLNQRVCAINGPTPDWSRYFFHAIPIPLKIVNDLTFSTTVKHLAAFQVLKERIPAPPSSEVSAIVAFLDRETTRIDALIEKKQRLIELLKEKRQAVITQAVTKGLDPNVPMKDSGVEWLGEVPERWDVKRVKYLVESCEQGWSPQCENRQAGAGEYGVMKVGCVNGGVFAATENKALPAEFEPRTQYSLKGGDFLISRANTKELVGSAAVVEQDWPYLLLCDKLYRLRLTDQVDPKYIAYYIVSHPVREQIELSASGASDSMQNIGQADVLELAIALPPQKEAAMIVHRLQTDLSTLEEIGNKTAKTVELLREHRSTLITAAVTGQIDVRHAA